MKMKLIQPETFSLGYNFFLNTFGRISFTQFFIVFYMKFCRIYIKENESENVSIANSTMHLFTASDTMLALRTQVCIYLLPVTQC